MVWIRERGLIHTPLLLFLATAGILFFLLFAASSTFKSGLFSLLFPKPVSRAATAIDVTSQIENLGNPFSAKPTFARNVWDMQVFNGKIFIGVGDAVSNSGPIDLAYFDPVAASFKKDTSSGTLCGTSCVDEEQIYNFRITDNTLYLPGYDPRESLALGNFYRIENGVWKKYRTIPGGIHGYDIYKFGTETFVGIEPGSTATGLPTTIQVSADNGTTWQNVTYCCKTSNPFMAGRIQTFFELGGIFYANTNLFSDSLLLAYQGNKTFKDLGAASGNGLFPGSPKVGRYVFKPVNFNNQLLYLGASGGVPFGLYSASNLTNAKSILLPNSALPRDITVSGATAYVLASTGSVTTYINYVFSSTDLINWSEEFHFSSNTFARSFELLNGDFYFGMGTDSTTSPASSTGNILRVKQLVYNSPPVLPPLSSTLSPPVISNPITPSPGSKQGDINGDNSINIIDLSILLSKWSTNDLSADLNKDSNVNIVDLSILLSNWGK